VELVQAGFAHYYIKREKLAQFEAEIIEKTTDKTNLEDVVKIVDKYKETVELKYPNEEFIKDMFGRNSVQDIYNGLKEASAKNEMAGKLVKLMDSQCPVSMGVIFEQIKRGAKLDLAENFKMDFRIVTRFMQGKDFFEGVRCTLVDRNDTPKWEHKSIFDVKSNEVDAYFKHLPKDKELVL